MRISKKAQQIEKWDFLGMIKIFCFVILPSYEKYQKIKMSKIDIDDCQDNCFDIPRST